MPWLHSCVTWLAYTVAPADVTRAFITKGIGPQSTAVTMYNNQRCEQNCRKNIAILENLSKVDPDIEAM